ncbi:MAG TPA: Crp/Fnr family transcriptional regulator [Clostridia bacterium]|nr:Crp/Fnr family transcriptional regulator [Clostridia bacterium]
MDIAELKALPLLAALPDSVLQALPGGPQSRLLACREGQLLHSEGEACATLDIILSGNLAVERISEDGNLMRVAEFGPGDSIGGNLLFSSDPVYHLAVTATRPTRLLRIQKEALISLLKRHEGFLLAYLGSAADKALVLEGQLTRYANLPLRTRILNYLRAQRRAQGSGRVALNGSKKTLAAQLGVHRSSLSRMLQQMKQEGLLDFDRASITLLTD